MQLRIFTEPQLGASYDDLLAVARKAEHLGFDAFFRSDHYLNMGIGSGLPGPTDAWITLAGLARDTSTIRLGTLVTAATFRHPGPLGISVATVDQMSGGRVELGLGAAWYDDEHRAYGIPFPPLGERFDRLTEQLAILTGMWATPTGETFTHTGEHYRLEESPGLPKSAQDPLPIIIGGAGPVRTPRLAARFAAEFNHMFPAPGKIEEMIERVGAACVDLGRDPSELTHSVAQTACVGVDHEDFARRAARLGRQPEEILQNNVAGTIDQARERLAYFADLGITRVYLQVLDLSDLEHLDVLARLLD